jgi:hypothetical protein
MPNPKIWPLYFCNNCGRNFNPWTEPPITVTNLGAVCSQDCATELNAKTDAVQKGISWLPVESEILWPLINSNWLNKKTGKRYHLNTVGRHSDTSRPIVGYSLITDAGEHSKTACWYLGLDEFLDRYKPG